MFLTSSESATPWLVVVARSICDCISQTTSQCPMEVPDSSPDLKLFSIREHSCSIREHSCCRWLYHSLLPSQHRCPTGSTDPNIVFKTWSEPNFCSGSLGCQHSRWLYLSLLPSQHECPTSDLNIVFKTWSGPKFSVPVIVSPSTSQSGAKVQRPHITNWRRSGEQVFNCDPNQILVGDYWHYRLLAL